MREPANFRRQELAAIVVALLSIASVVAALPVESRITQPQSPADFLNRAVPPISAEARREMEMRLEETRANFTASPSDADTSIWVGRRVAYLGRFREAIDWYSDAIRKFPDDARLYRHRGHRYITTRQFARAIADLKRAAQLIKGKPDQIEPDGQPNARNIPTSTLQFNIWYHLGLAYYLTGDNQKALASYRHCLKTSKTPDRLVATSHWLYMTLRRLGRTREAAKVLIPINQQMDIIENGSYHRLLLMYKGLISAEELEREALKEVSSAGSHSILYGIGNWHLYNGRKDAALRVFRQMPAGDQWTSFGYIAAEADMKRFQQERDRD